MRYLDIIKRCALLDYVELPTFRAEMWIDETGVYECMWFYSNNGLIPNTIKHNDY